MMFLIPFLSILAAQDPATFRAGVSLVRVDAQVTGPGSANLSQNDFVILDDGRPQKIVAFAHETEPLDLVLLLDVSGSMHRYLEQLTATAESALRLLHAADRAALMVFTREAVVREPLTDDLAMVAARIRDSVRQQNMGSGTAINSAILSAARYLQSEPVRGRRAILILTDNNSLNYRTPDDEVLRELSAADTVLNAIVTGKPLPRPAPKAGSYVNPDFTFSDVARLANQSGGETGNSLESMIAGIRSRYSLQYAAPEEAPGAFHRIEVRVPNRAVLVRARSGYYAR